MSACSHVRIFACSHIRMIALSTMLETLYTMLEPHHHKPRLIIQSYYTSWVRISSWVVRAGGRGGRSKFRHFFLDFFLDFLFCKWYSEILIGVLGTWGTGRGGLGGQIRPTFFFQKDKSLVKSFNSDWHLDDLQRTPKCAFPDQRCFGQFPFVLY